MAHRAAGEADLQHSKRFPQKYRPARWENCKILLATMLVFSNLTSCGGPSKTAPEAVTINRTSPLLPGEDIASASQRFYFACMDQAGIAYQIVNGEENGVPVTDRGYDVGQPSDEAKMRACQSATAAGFPLPVQTTSDLEHGYRYMVAIVACLADSGYDMGITPSYQEYTQARGELTPSSRWDIVTVDERYSENMSRCSKLVPPPAPR